MISFVLVVCSRFKKSHPQDRSNALCYRKVCMIVTIKLQRKKTTNIYSTSPSNLPNPISPPSSHSETKIMITTTTTTTTTQLLTKYIYTYD